MQKSKMGKFIDPYSLCPCGSDIKAKFCCLRGKLWYKAAGKLEPPGPMTGFSNPACYARSTNDCDQKITREHFISKSVLENIGDGKTSKISGLKWQKPQTFTVVGTKALTANVLCERHNNAFSPLDVAAMRLTRAIDEFQTGQRNSVATIEPEVRLFSGLDIEGWMLKTLIGLIKSGNLGTIPMRPGSADILVGKTPWPEGSGLFIDTSRPMYQSRSLLIETLIASVTVGASFELHGLRLVLLIGKIDSLPSTWTNRPTGITLRARGIDKTLQFSWQQQDRLRREVLCERQLEEFDGSPPHWEDWERNL